MIIGRQRRAPSPVTVAPLAPADRRWLTLIASLPVDDAGARMNVLRTVESLGAVVLRDGVYLLPDGDAQRASLDRLADYIRAATGDVHLLTIDARDAAQNAEFRTRFDRGPAYLEIGKMVASLANAYGVSDPTALARVLQRQRDDFERIAAIDFFGSPAKDHVAAQLGQAADAIRGLTFPEGAKAAPREPSRHAYFRRKWATRTPLHIDRLASAWLIRRFIDAEARLEFLDKHTAPTPDTVSYGFDGAEFANTRSHVTYEELLAFFQLQPNPPLARIGQLVTALVTGDVTVAEARGIETMLRGAANRAASDAALVDESDKTFDLLYERYAEPPKHKH